MKRVKYIFKYIHKGHDCANIEIREDTLNLEIATYLDTRSGSVRGRVLASKIEKSATSEYLSVRKFLYDQLDFLDTFNISI